MTQEGTLQESFVPMCTLHFSIPGPALFTTFVHIQFRTLSFAVLVPRLNLGTLQSRAASLRICRS